MKKKTPTHQRDLDDYSHHYRGALYRYEKQMVQIRRRHLREQMRAHPHKRILEVGCGMAPLFMAFAGYQKMTVVEPTAAFYRNALQLLDTLPAARAKRVEVINAPMEGLGDALREHRFDCAFAVGLLHEVEAPQTFLTALRRALPRGAVLHVNVPNANSFHRLLALEMGLIKTLHERSPLQRRLQQPRTFDVAMLRKLVRECGFSVIHDDTHFIKPFTHAQMAALQDSGLLDARLQRGLERMTRHIPQMGAEIYLTARAK